MTEKGVEEYDELVRMLVNFNDDSSQQKNMKSQEPKSSHKTINVVKESESSENLVLGYFDK
ncbi:MAG: hypothetical protein ACTSYC_07140 [Promethearchaeota archaeon]